MDTGTLWAQGWRTVVVVVLLGVAALLTFLSGLGGRPLGTAWATLVLATGTATATALLWWRRPGRTAALALAVFLAVVLGVAIGIRTPPGPVVLGGALEAIPLPADAQLVDASGGGNVLCFDVCPTARREYVVPAEPGDVVTRVRAALDDLGYTLQDPVDPRSFTTELDGHREWYVTGRAEPAPGGEGTLLSLRATATG